MREDWVECKLGNICEIVSGNTPKGIEQIQNIGDFHFYKVSDMNSQGNESCMTVSNLHLSEGDLKKLKIKVFPKGTVIFPKRGGAILTNKKRRLSKVSSFDLNIMGVLPNAIVNEDFLFKWFLRLDLSRICDGSNVPQINNKNIVPLPFALPPLPEQRAIVKKLESLFSSLDAGVADLKKAQQQLKIYRQAVLKKAFDITATVYKLIEICEEMFAGGDKPTDFFSPEKNAECSVPIFANAVKDKGLYGFTKNARVTKAAITIAGRGSGTGHVEIRNESFVPIVRLITIVPKTDIISLKFLYFFLKNLKIDVSGSAIPQLTIPMIKDYEINIPNLTKQLQIVKEIESRLSVCDSIEQSIKESLTKAEALRQSILKKAFEGKLLTEQELAECRQAADYEPASVLLERIKAEQKGAIPDKKRALDRKNVNLLID